MYMILDLACFSTSMTLIFMAISTLVLMGAPCNYAETTTDNLTVIVENTSGKELYPMLVCADGRPEDCRPVPSKGSISIRLKHDRLCSLSFAAGCTLDRSGHPTNCSTGGCGEGRCTVATPPPVATMVIFDHGTVETTTENGYNFGLRGVFQCVACPSFSCVIALNRCPENLRAYDNLGSVVGCNPGDGIPSGQDCLAIGTYADSPSTVFTCPIKNGILKITVT